MVFRFAQAASQGETVHARQHHVQHQHVERGGETELQSFASVMRDNDLMALFGQGAFEEVRHAKLVFGYENLHLASMVSERFLFSPFSIL